MSQVKRKIDWKTYLAHLGFMADCTKVAGNQVVVGLTRGGLTPATYLSHQLGIPMIAFDPHMLHANGDERAPIHLPINPPVITKIIIVDDISDTGITFKKCFNFFNKRGFSCTTMSVFINGEVTEFVPDYPGEETNNEWIVFPYETE